MAKISKTLKKDLKQSKYRAKKIVVDGIKFDSIAESEYYTYLKVLKSAGGIKDIILQPQFILHEKFQHSYEGKIRSITYKADFMVTYAYTRDNDVIDIKGMATPVSLMKRKMFLKKFPDLNLQWLAKSKKYSETGWIDYFTLEKIRKDNRKKKANQ